MRIKRFCAVILVLSAAVASASGCATRAPARPAARSVRPVAAAERRSVKVEMAAEENAPAKRAADSVALLAGGMVAAASAAFAGTGLVRRRKFRR